MEPGLLLKGILIGFSIAAPVGPISVLCIRRTLTDGRAAGLLSGLGAATADAIYGCIAAFGLTTISNALVTQQALFRPVGGAFLLYLAIKTFIAKPMEEGANDGQGTLSGAYVSTFFLTLTNPMTILSFAAIFAGLGLGSSYENYLAGTILVLGVFMGSTLWWLILSGGVGLVRGNLNPGRLRWVNRVSGAVIGIFGLLALAGPRW